MNDRPPRPEPAWRPTDPTSRAIEALVRIDETLQDICQLLVRLTVAVELNTVKTLADAGITVTDPSDPFANIPEKERYRFGPTKGPDDGRP